MTLLLYIKYDWKQKESIANIAF